MNRFIAEKVMKEWWPITDHTMPDYTTSSDYFALLQFAIKKEWWDKFIGYSMGEWLQTQKVGWHISAFTQWLLAPENFDRLVAEYHGWKEEGK